MSVKSILSNTVKCIHCIVLTANSGVEKNVFNYIKTVVIYSNISYIELFEKLNLLE